MKNDEEQLDEMLMGDVVQKKLHTEQSLGD
jgi:hypothetical protein